MTHTERPDFIRNVQTGLRSVGTGDRKATGNPLGRDLGLTRLGIHYEIVPPGHRTSFPHAESHEEEFVLVLKGTPDVWIDGTLHELVEGDAVAFPAGTGIAHSFLNNSTGDVHLLVVGEANKPENRISYPVDPERMQQYVAKGLGWTDVPSRTRGPHPGQAIAGTRKV